MLDIHQLNVFLAAAESLSFTHAAQKLHMTQPSISQHIQVLERHFGTDLFIRSGRNLELTDAGLALIPLAREAVALSVRIDETLATLKGDVIGHLVVGCTTTPGKYVLPQLLARFHSLYPQVRATCLVSSQQQAIEALLNGSSHFTLASLAQGHHPDLESYKLFYDCICLIAPLDHPWAARGQIEPEELLEGVFIQREDTSGTYAAVSAALAEKNISIRDLNVLITLGNAEAVTLAVQEGLGVGFTSRSVVERLGQGRVAYVGIRDMQIGRDVYFARHARRPATVAQLAFWEFVRHRDNPMQQLEMMAAVHSTEIPMSSKRNK